MARAFVHARGAAAIELVIALPVLLLLAMGVAEFGRLYFTAINVTNAARAGAQYGAQSAALAQDTAGIRIAVQNDAADIGSITVSSTHFCRCADNSAVACDGTCPGYGLPQVFVQVTGTRNVPFLLRYPGLPTSMTVSRTATFRAQ